MSGAALNLPTKFGEDRPRDLGEVREQTEKKNRPLTSMTLTFQKISGAALNLPTKFGEDRPKDLGEVGEQNRKKKQI